MCANSVEALANSVWEYIEEERAKRPKLSVPAHGLRNS